MSGMNAAAPDPAQELGAEDEVTAFNNEEEGEYEGDESLNDIKDELQLEADSDKTKTSSGHPQATIVTAQAFPVNQPTFLVNGGLIHQRLPMLAPGSAQPVDPSRRVLPMAHVYSLQALQGLSTVPTVKMEVPASSASYHAGAPGVMYPGYPAGIPVVPTTPGVGYPYVLGSPYVPVLQQNMLGPQGSVVQGMVPGNPSQPPPEKKKPHVKKPLNAFMLFMREKRADVMKECSLKESAAINQILGKMWHALSKEEQEKYYDMARHERAKHMQMYPGWSARDNYAIHKKRKKRKPAKEVEESSTSDIDPNAKKCRARHGMEQQDLWCQPCRRKKKCERYGEGDEDDEDEECMCEHVSEKKMEGAMSDNIGNQSHGGSSQEASHQVVGDSNHTGVNGSGDGTVMSKDTIQGLVPLTT